MEKTPSWIQEELESRAFGIKTLVEYFFQLSWQLFFLIVCKLLGGWRKRRFEHEGNAKNQEDEEATWGHLAEEQEKQ